MTPEGYRMIKFALATSPETERAEASPKPKPGEDIRYLHISGPGLNRIVLLGVLGQAGLTRMSKEPHPSPKAPVLAFLPPDGNQKTKEFHFEDIKAA